MALQGSGAISLQNIATEFGGGAPHALSEYYRGGGLVPNVSNNNAVPLSGVISHSNFYNAANRVAVTVNITANQVNYVFNTAKVPGYVAGATDVIFNIASGVYLSATTTGVFGGDVDLSWAAGDTVRINNNGGFIVGMGGAGGVGAGWNSGNYGVIGGSGGAGGGPAFRAQRSIKLYNGGTIGGGGGGGGGGGSRSDYYQDGKYAGYIPQVGGGGGGGRTGTSNSGGGGGGPYTRFDGFVYAVPVSGYPGAVGTLSGGGAGGNGSDGNTANAAGKGGNGGTWGAAGGTGLRAPQYPGSSAYQTAGPYGGGAAGTAIVGNGNISYIDAAGNPTAAVGTRLGAVT